MGCMVNGPGEAKEADIGLACGRDGGVIFRKGKVLRKVRAAKMAEALVAEVRRMAAGVEEKEAANKKGR